MNTRVRYAPSPTGLQHIGSARTALFNYLFAKSSQGVFILRIEDTDQERSKEIYVHNLYDTLAWMGLRWDEGPDIGGKAAPYIQSQRSDLYRSKATELVENGFAYHCFCTPARLESLRSQQTGAASSEQGYDRHCRSLTLEEQKARTAQGEPSVVRLKIPLEGTTAFVDELLGEIAWKNVDINPDPVMLKSDGLPTYHLANVIDDHFMEISHVLRSQEWISSTPLHSILYKAFDWAPPAFLHLPMVVGADGHKLSKRHGSTAIDEFRNAGYLPEALVNYIALLGASYEEGKELYSLEELEKHFDPTKLNKSASTFDYQKLEWFNGQYLRQLSPEALLIAAQPFLAAAFSPAELSRERTFLCGAMELARERIKTLADMPAVIGFLLKEPGLPALPEFLPKKMQAPEVVTILEAHEQLLARCDLTNHETSEAAFRATSESMGIKFGDFMLPLRVALTGSKASPPLFPSIKLLGADACKARLNRVLEYFLRAVKTNPPV